MVKPSSVKPSSVKPSSVKPSLVKPSLVKPSFVKPAKKEKTNQCDDDVIDTTPNKSKKLKLKLLKINSHTQSEKKVVTKKEESEQRNETSSKSNLNDLFSGISPIPKQATNSRKLSLKKPLKRRCSFSPKETLDKKKKVQVGTHFVIKLQYGEE